MDRSPRSRRVPQLQRNPRTHQRRRAYRPLGEDVTRCSGPDRRNLPLRRSRLRLRHDPASRGNAGWTRSEVQTSALNGNHAPRVGWQERPPRQRATTLQLAHGGLVYLPLDALEDPDEINRFKASSDYAEDLE